MTTHDEQESTGLRAMMVALSALLLLSSTCGGGGGTNHDGSSLSDASLDPNRTLASLASGDASMLCDAINTPQGGYGRSAQCSDGTTQHTDSSRADCVASFPAVAAACPTLTVGQAVGCANATGPDLCKYLTVSECAPVRACLGP